MARGRGQPRHLPHRQGLDLHGDLVHPALRRPRDPRSIGRVGSCFDNAAAEAFFSSLEWEVLSRHEFDTRAQARAVVIDWAYGFYNHQRRHSAAGMMSPVNYEQTTATPVPDAA
ncbi:integrase core domain-containing protein [Cutibacterium avidum]|uniref:integrase core domain-containing protein n=1 Tax=Cutibacterium avidum TaxID=33010 RepID=UPI002FF42A16